MPVPVDSFTLTFLAAELASLLRGREISEVGIGEGRLLVVRFAGEAGAATASIALKFLYHSAFPLLFVEAGGGRLRWERAPRFEEPLRGARLTGVEQIGLERAISITATGRDGAAWHLHFELTPPLPNLFLADGRDRVAAMLLRAGTHTRKRMIVQGQRYIPPTLQAKTEPDKLTAAELAALRWQTDDQALSRVILGVSPFLSGEIAWQAREQGALEPVYRGFLDRYRAQRASPSYFHVSSAISKLPPRIGIAWFAPSMAGVTDLKPMASVNAAAVAAFHAFMRVSALDARRAAVLAGISRERARWQAVARGARQSIERRPVAAQYRQLAELILANPKMIPKGASSARLPDIYSQAPVEVEVQLDARLTPHSNADAYFKKARRIVRSAAMAEDTLRNARRRLADLEAIHAEVESPTTTLARLRQLTGEAGRGTSGRQGEETDRRAAALGIKPRRFVVSGGWIVLVGRSAAENDILTHKYARPSDLWFHARQAQGSHVILRRDRKQTQTQRQAIIEAAGIAAYYSKSKTSKHVPVSYTERRYVKKVRGGPPGLAAMLREKVIFVTPVQPKDTQTP
jgi:predicted ribosome quality control (RQC) complex YloA/Tae2 family protein